MRSDAQVSSSVPRSGWPPMGALAGLGTIARVVRDGAEIYRRRLPLQEALTRIDTCYKPYHAELRTLVDTTRARFGHAVLIDCHSMPSVGGPLDQDIGSARPDIILGDRFGTACARRLTDTVERVLAMQGFAVVRNNPYAGGFTTEHYGRPVTGVHSTSWLMEFSALCRIVSPWVDMPSSSTRSIATNHCGVLR